MPKHSLLRLYKQILTCEADPVLRCSVNKCIKRAKHIRSERHRNELLNSMREQYQRIKSKTLKLRLMNLIDTMEEDSDHTPTDDEDEATQSDDGSDTFYEIKKITGMRLSRDNRRLYRVQWSGHDDSDDDTWEPMQRLVEDGCGDLIAQFHRQIRKMV